MENLIAPDLHLLLHLVFRDCSIDLQLAGRSQISDSVMKTETLCMKGSRASDADSELRSTWTFDHSFERASYCGEIVRH